MIPYGKQLIEDDDIQAVVDVLRSDFLTQGPMVAAFEEAFARRVGTKYAVAVNSGTAALHACMVALGIGPGDEVIVPPITFTASANCVLFVGGTPVFADVTTSGHIDPAQIERKVTKKTKAVIAVDYAGWPCDYARILDLCRKHGLTLICDACHALGASWQGKPVGSIGKLNSFSFHPVKHIATGEGGMITTDDDTLAERMREFRTHGITKEARKFKGLIPGFSVQCSGKNTDSETEHRTPSTEQAALRELGPWHYEMHSLGYNYRLSDINCALGLSQLKKLDRFVTRRREIAKMYYDGLKDIPHLELPVSDLVPAFMIPDPVSRIPYPASTVSSSSHSFHLFPVLIDFQALGKTRTQLMAELRAKGVGTQVHYIPVCLQPYYRGLIRAVTENYSCAIKFFLRELSIPMYAGMSDDDVRVVINALIAGLKSAKAG